MIAGVQRPMLIYIKLHWLLWLPECAASHGDLCFKETVHWLSRFLWFTVDITIVNGVDKQTYNWGFHPVYIYIIYIYDNSVGILRYIPLWKQQYTCVYMLLTKKWDSFLAICRPLCSFSHSSHLTVWPSYRAGTCHFWIIQWQVIKDCIPLKLQWP
jgi:hypothetical protein